MTYSKVIANLRIEKNLKEQASDLAKQMGVSLSTIMTLLLQKFVKEKRIEVWLDENGFSLEKKQIFKSALQDVRTKGETINSLDDLL